MCWYSFNPVYGLYSAHGFLPAWIASSRVLYLTRFFAETTQAPDRSDILNVGGFSDAVFSIVAAILAEVGGRLVVEVEAVEL